MSIHDLIKSVIEANSDTITGMVASEFYEMEDISGEYCWGCDVDIGQPMSYTDVNGKEQTTTVMRSVPIAMNNREIFYAQMGWPVLLRRMSNAKYAIVGMAKALKTTTDITYVSFINGMTIKSREIRGYYYRRLTLGEMGTIEPFGTLPLGALGIFNAADDTFVRIKS